MQQLAGENWSIRKVDLLKDLCQRDNWRVQEAKVDIFLDEGLIDDAIAALGDYASHRLTHRVMEAAISHRAEWVMEKARRYAEEIMNQGKASAYDEAVEWLRKARSAYLQLGQSTEWKHYRTQLMTTHGRKYKLMGLLKQPEFE